MSVSGTENVAIPPPAAGRHLSAAAIPPLLRAAIIVASFAGNFFGASVVRGADIYNGNGFDIRWDNTLRYDIAVRLSPRDTTLLAPMNGDDGDRNFARGLISNRFDLLSQFDLSHGDFGLHASVAAWYDTVYHMRTANDSPATYNPISVPNTQFAPAVRNLHGQYVDPRDAFAYGNFAIANVPVSLRIGRQTVLWGESLFFDDNSIAATQAPVDYIKGMTERSAYSNDIFLPVNQVSITAQPAPDFSLSFYYQLEWRSSRQPGDGSYFSDLDYIGAGAERIFLSPNQFLVRQRDKRPPASGQYGAALHLALDDVNFGFYVLRFNAKNPVQIFDAEQVVSHQSGEVGDYRLAYPSGIQLYGLSASGYLGGSNVAGEVSIRQHAPLATYSAFAPQTVTQAGRAYYDYTRGNLFHAQLSTTTTFAPSPLWDSADLNVEMAIDDILGLIEHEEAGNPAMHRFVMRARFLFEPHYFEVLPNLDVTIPVGFGHDLVGRSTNYLPYDSTDDFEIGVSATYRSVWKASVMLTSFLGSPSRQPLADRNFIMASIERTF